MDLYIINDYFSIDTPVGNLDKKIPKVAAQPRESASEKKDKASPDH